jgi:hypothetical protein
MLSIGCLLHIASCAFGKCTCIEKALAHCDTHVANHKPRKQLVRKIPSYVAREVTNMTSQYHHSLLCLRSQTGVLVCGHS